MKIDLEEAQNEFIKYTEKFNLEDKNIKRKQLHSLRVMNNAKQIATNLKLSEEQVQIATLIGLLHDIGRFKQYTEIGMGDNLEGFDHGDYGAKILFEDGMIRKFIEPSKYDEIIREAIKNHNKFSIEDGLTEEELIFAKLIRDADKLDILYESVEIFYKGQEEKINKSILSYKTYNQFMNKILVKKEKNIKLEYIDNIICILAFIFDINYVASFQILKQKDYINSILNRYNFEDTKTQEMVNEIRKLANEYVTSKIKEKTV